MCRRLFEWEHSYSAGMRMQVTKILKSGVAVHLAPDPNILALNIPFYFAYLEKCNVTCMSM